MIDYTDKTVTIDNIAFSLHPPKGKGRYTATTKAIGADVAATRKKLSRFVEDSPFLVQVGSQYCIFTPRPSTSK